MDKLKLDIKALKDNTDTLMIMNKKNFEVLQHSSITLDEKGIRTNADTTDDTAIPFRDSLVISSLIFNALLLIAEKWDSLDNECRELVENNLEMIVYFMEEK